MHASDAILDSDLAPYYSSIPKGRTPNFLQPLHLCSLWCESLREARPGNMNDGDENVWVNNKFIS